MDLREILGYSKSKRFYGPDRADDLPPNELAFALRLAAIAGPAISGPKLASKSDVRFDGAYVLQQEAKSAAIPVVFVFQVTTETIAKRVHQFVWNQNQSPFLIVESPSTIRVYPGFAFQHEGDNSLVSVAKGTAATLEMLAAFRAESIDDGTVWTQWAHAVDPSKRVDESLLRDLESLDKRLQADGVIRTASHGLIGKFVYLRYLRDRNILSDKKLAKWEIHPDHLFTRSATLKAFRKVNDELQTWLNGSVFSLGDADLATIKAPQLQLVAGVFRGDSPVGDDTLQPSLFDSYDFSHIPIETLSCVYEQFLHDAKEKDGTSRGKTLGAYYTPLPLAEYVISELENRRPLEPGMKVLDPAQGSGVFLVQCYRRLVEKQRRKKGRELKKSELRDLLTENIFGIDRDDDACRVAELSLIMTLLDYVEPPDLEDTSFQLPRLRGHNIFGPWKDAQGQEHKVDFFDGSGPVHEMLAPQKFDWIVGNPPWAEVKKTPAEDHEHHVAFQWMKTHRDTHPTSGNQIAEAFLWKTGQHLTSDGICGLVVLAMTWFKKEGTTFRKRFFSERRVSCLANFANMGFVLFARRSNVGASVVFFESTPPDDDHRILAFSPFIAEQVANRPQKPGSTLITWNIVVGDADIREVESADAKSGESITWKLAMWGTSRDRKLLQRLDDRFNEKKIDALKNFNIGYPHEGLQLRPAHSNEEVEAHPELAGKTKLLFKKLKNLGRIFAFPDDALGKISSEECFVRKGRGILPIAVSTPPHIIVDASRRFAIFSDEFIAVPARQIGIAGDSRSSMKMLRALSLLLSSDFCVYHQFLTSPQWGIDMNRADLHALVQLPAPLGRLSAADIDAWAELQRKLESASRRRFANDIADSDDNMVTLLAELNDRVYRLLELKKSERWLVEDFVNLQMALTKGKATRAVLRQPTNDERLTYLLALRDCLDSFLTIEPKPRHKIEVLSDRDSAMLAVSLVQSRVAVDPVINIADASASQNLKVIRDRLRSRHSQWVYFDRALKVYERGVLYHFKPLQRLHWTRRRAVLDADDIIAETIAKGGTS
jgi:hypothetical protein